MDFEGGGDDTQDNKKTQSTRAGVKRASLFLSIATAKVYFHLSSSDKILEINSNVLSAWLETTTTRSGLNNLCASVRAEEKSERFNWMFSPTLPCPPQNYMLASSSRPNSVCPPAVAHSHHAHCGQANRRAEVTAALSGASASAVASAATALSRLPTSAVNAMDAWAGEANSLLPSIQLPPLHIGGNLRLGGIHSPKQVNH